MSLPKYFENLTLGIGAISGDARIVSVNKKNPNKPTDKYKSIDDETWFNCLLNFCHLRKQPFYNVLTDFTFLIGGKLENKEELIKFLEGIVEQLKNV